MNAAGSKDRQRPFGLTAATIRLLESAGYIAIKPRLADYTFQELVLLRTISALQAARLPRKSIKRALQELKPWLNVAESSARVFFDATIAALRVRDGHLRWELGTGQYELPLQAAPTASNIIPIIRHEKEMKKKEDAAHAHYLRGSALEQDDRKAAQAAYESCLAGDCRHLEARINLGLLLHVEGQLREADAIYKAHEEPNALLFFNWGVLLEDMKRELEAIEAYRKAIVHDPGMADAHFNLSMLHERLGNAQASFRHLLAYRRLSEAHQSKVRKRS